MSGVGGSCGIDGLERNECVNTDHMPPNTSFFASLSSFSDDGGLFVVVVSGRWLRDGGRDGNVTWIDTFDAPSFQAHLTPAPQMLPLIDSAFQFEILSYLHSNSIRITSRCPHLIESPNRRNKVANRTLLALPFHGIPRPTTNSTYSGHHLHFQHTPTSKNMYKHVLRFGGSLSMAMAGNLAWRPWPSVRRSSCGSLRVPSLSTLSPSVIRPLTTSKSVPNAVRVRSIFASFSARIAVRVSISTNCVFPLQTC